MDSNKKEFTISQLLKYRSIWMAIAIIWVMFFHLPVDWTSNFFVWAFRKVSVGGVDIFIFASGIGCFMSLSRNFDITSFYKKRFVKIMPTYWIFIVCWLIYYKVTDIGAIAGNVLCLQSFSNDGYVPERRAFNWYMSMIWLVYLLAPILVQFFISVKNELVRFAVLLVIVAGSFAFWHDHDLIFMATRMPIFFIGMWVCANKDKPISFLWRIILGIVLVASFVGGVVFLIKGYLFHLDLGWEYGLPWYPYIFITPPLCTLISLICLFFDKIKIGKYIEKPIKVIGDNTLELYLVHVFVFEAYGELTANEKFVSSPKKVVAAVCLSIILAVVLHYASIGVRKVCAMMHSKVERS